MGRSTIIGTTLLLLLCARAAPAQSGTPRTAVDLAALPAVGVTFVVDQVVEIEGVNVTKAPDEEESRSRTVRRLGITFTQSVDEAKDGRLTKITRTYGKCTESFRLVQGKKDERREEGYFLSRLKATWTPRGMLFAAPKSDEAGQRTSYNYKDFVRAPRVPRPFFPPPDHLVSPGDSWEIDQEVLTGFYRTELRLRPRRRRGPRREPPRVDHTFRLIRIEETGGRRIAVVGFQASMRTGEAAGEKQRSGRSVLLTIAATYRFCLQHKIVVGADYRSEFEETRSTGKGDERRLSVHSATIHGKAKVRVVAPDGEPGSRRPSEASRPPK